jgi:hypothetical protein
MPSTPETPLTPLGAALRAGRERDRLSIRQAAKLAKFSHTTWTSLETGIRSTQGEKVSAGKPDPGFVIAAARVVDLDVAEALRLAGYDPRHWTTAPQPDGPVADHRTVAERIALLNDTQLAAVAAIVHLMPAPTPRAVDTNGEESDVA